MGFVPLSRCPRNARPNGALEPVALPCWRRLPGSETDLAVERVLMMQRRLVYLIDSYEVMIDPKFWEALTPGELLA